MLCGLLWSHALDSVSAWIILHMFLFLYVVYSKHSLRRLLTDIFETLTWRESPATCTSILRKCSKNTRNAITPITPIYMPERNTIYAGISQREGIQLNEKWSKLSIIPLCRHQTNKRHKWRWNWVKCVHFNDCAVASA